MRRALALVFLLLFAATSESAALCLITPYGTAGGHDCCPDSASPVSLTTCCGISRPDRDRTPDSPYVGAILVVLSNHPLVQHDCENFRTPSVTHSLTNDNAPVPLYLQHLSLLI
jgi:hypothetical protein